MTSDATHSQTCWQWHHECAVSRIARALTIRDAHRETGGHVEMQCVCAGCEMGRALDGETPRRWRP